MALMKVPQVGPCHQRPSSGLGERGRKLHSLAEGDGKSVGPRTELGVTSLSTTEIKSSFESWVDLLIC